jgi:hypothetical protein
LQFQKFLDTKNVDSYWCISDCDEFVPNVESSVGLGSPAVHDLCNVNAIVTRNVLIADASCNAETQSFGALDEFYL